MPQVSDWVGGEWVLLRRLCGRIPGDALLSSGNRLRVVFRSDETGVAEGFKASWGVQCGFNKTLGEGEAAGEVTSPGYPDGYKPSLNCSYELHAPGRVILAQFTNFSVEPGRATLRWKTKIRLFLTFVVTLGDSYATFFVPSGPQGVTFCCTIFLICNLLFSKKVHSPETFCDFSVAFFGPF